MELTEKQADATVDQAGHVGELDTPSGQPISIPTLNERFGWLIGLCNDLPSDFAAEHDHYIHGTPRREPRESK